MAPNRRGQPQSDRHRSAGRKHLTEPLLDFCIKRAHGDSIRVAAAKCGIPEGTALAWALRPEIIAQIDKYVAQIADDKYTKERKARMLSLDSLDVQVLTRLQKSKKTTEITVDLIRTGYESVGAIQRGGVRVSASAGAQAILGQPNSLNFADVYEAKWLRDRKSQWDQQLEQKYAEPAALPPGPDSQS